MIAAFFMAFIALTVAGSAGYLAYATTAGMETSIMAIANRGRMEMAAVSLHAYLSGLGLKDYGGDDWLDFPAAMSLTDAGVQPYTPWGASYTWCSRDMVPVGGNAAGILLSPLSGHATAPSCADVIYDGTYRLLGADGSLVTVFGLYRP